MGATPQLHIQMLTVVLSYPGRTRKCLSWRPFLVLVEMDILVIWNVKWALRSDSKQMAQPVGKLEAVGKLPDVIDTGAGFLSRLRDWLAWNCSAVDTLSELWLYV